MSPRNYKIGTRLHFGFGLMLGLTLLVGGLGLVQIRDLASQTERLYRHPFTVNSILRDLRGNQRQIDTVLADLDPGVAPFFVENKAAEIAGYEKQVFAAIPLAKERYLGDKNELTILAKDFQDWFDKIHDVLRAFRNNLGAQEQHKAVQAAREHGRVLAPKIQHIIDFAGDRAREFHSKALSRERQAYLAMSALVALAALAAILVSLLTTRGITVPLLTVVQRIQGIAKGDVGDELDDTGDDELAELARSFRAMREGLKAKAAVAEAVAAGDYARHVELGCPQDILGKALNTMTQALRLASEANAANDWTKSGKNELAARMAGEPSLAALAEGVTGFLAPYLNAQLGALYVLNGDQTLNLAGGYAYTPRDGLADTIALGQGLVGQAALMDKPVVVTDIPQDYVRIRSALGEARPTNILLCPLTHEGRVKGVLEVGSFKPFTQVHLDFLEQAAESVGQAIATVENQARLRELLEETQLQAEKLQTQQEELRSINEELEQQAQALRASEEELRQQQEELQVANEELSLKNDSLERQKAEISLKNVELDNTRQGLEQKAKELELSSRYKSDFLANMSHELRTPLNSLLLLSRTLMDNVQGNLSAGQVEYARIIHRSGGDLLALINEILDLAKIEAGKMTLAVKDVHLTDLAASLASAFKPLTDDKGLALSVSVDDDLPPTLRTDPQRCQQILRNLMSNAVKFCDHGGVTVRFHRPEASGGPGRGGLAPERSLAVSVTDTGVGIPEDKHLEIFEAFQQAESGTARKFGGTGLGLTISRELAHLLGGEIRLVSTPGKGSTFTLLVPLEPPQDQEATPQNLPDATSTELAAAARHAPDGQERAHAPQARPCIPDDRDSLRENQGAILIIEDDQDFAGILADQCHAKGFQVLAAATGESGLELARRYRPGAVILDIKLPGMSGWQVLDALKNDPALRHIPVHVMSGLESGLEAMHRGAVGFLPKPASREGLEQAFLRMKEVMSGKIKELILVEDDMTTRKAIIELIADPGLNVVEAADAGQAMALIKARRFDCMVLDLGLPDMSGFELLERLKADHDAQLPPVIVYTGRELTREEERRLRDHADSIIIKGLRSEERLIDETALFLHQVVKSLPARKRDTIMHLYDKDAIFKGRTVLLVDDDMRNLFALAQVLEAKGIAVVKAEDGQKALDILAQEAKVDLALMDIMMPGMDGYETIRRIRAHKRFQSLPVIALTAKAMPTDRAKCIEAGASDYLSKPVELDRLLSVMRVWLYKEDGRWTPPTSNTWK